MYKQRVNSTKGKNHLAASWWRARTTVVHPQLMNCASNLWPWNCNLCRLPTIFYKSYMVHAVTRSHGFHMVFPSVAALAVPVDASPLAFIERAGRSTSIDVAEIVKVVSADEVLRVKVGVFKVSARQRSFDLVGSGCTTVILRGCIVKVDVNMVVVGASGENRAVVVVAWFEGGDGGSSESEDGEYSRELHFGEVSRN